MAKLPYQIVVELNPAHGPYGKMPFVQIGGRRIADSSLIIAELARLHGCGDVIAQGTEEGARAVACQRIVEDHLYWALLYSRWLDDGNFAKTKTSFAALFPPVIGSIFIPILRRRLRQQAYQQGLGRLPPHAIYAQGLQDLKTLETMLGSRRFFHGTTLTATDAMVIAFLWTLLAQPLSSPLQTFINESSALITYVQRTLAALDWELSLGGGAH